MSSYLIYKNYFLFIYKNPSKILFFFILIIRTLLIISSTSWLRAWIALEINLISFIAFILINKKSNLIEASIIYFISQSLASIIFLLSILINTLILKTSQQNLIWTSKILLLALIIKIGAAPLHFWLPLTIEGISWINNYLLITWQKLGPIILVSYNVNFWLSIFIIISAITGAIGGLNQSSIKKLISFSSINQIRWFLLALSYKKALWNIYLFFYFFVLINVILIFITFNLNFINQIYLLNYNKIILIFIFISILSIGGLPPFLGFFPKILIIIRLSNYLLILLIILRTLITLYYYLRLIYFLILINFNTINSIIKININYSLIIKFSFLTNFFLLLIIFL